MRKIGKVEAVTMAKSLPSPCKGLYISLRKNLSINLLNRFNYIFAW